MDIEKVLKHLKEADGYFTVADIREELNYLIDRFEKMSTCNECKGEGFIVIEDVELVIKECNKCKGEGRLNKL